VVITLLLVSTAMGVVGRTVPQLNILVLGFPLKILVGTFVLAASIPFFGGLVGDVLASIPIELARIAWSVAGGG
jgi:flagellar biosynthesis protein FliR